MLCIRIVVAEKELLYVELMDGFWSSRIME